VDLAGDILGTIDDFLVLRIVPDASPHDLLLVQILRVVSIILRIRLSLLFSDTSGLTVKLWQGKG